MKQAVPMIPIEPRMAVRRLEERKVPAPMPKPAATGADDLLIVNGAVAEREGNVASWATIPGSTMGPFQTKQGINSAGTYVFKNNTSEASTADDYVVTNSAGTYTVQLAVTDNAGKTATDDFDVMVP